MNFLKPPQSQDKVSAAKIKSTYQHLRWQIFLSIFIGYAGYYLLRNNFTIALPQLINEGFTKSQLGLAFSAVSISYGFIKFIMWTISDSSNARIFYHWN